MISPTSSSWGPAKGKPYAVDSAIPISIWLRKFEDYLEMTLIDLIFYKKFLQKILNFFDKNYILKKLKIIMRKNTIFLEHC